MPADRPTVRISGFGGLFFRCRDPQALARWYADHFGIKMVGDGPPWMQEAGYTVFSPFPADTDYFGRMDQHFMLNFRVDDIEQAVTRLRKAGVRIDEARMDEPYGKFAWVYDPEDNKIELWEPKDPAA
jgi:predicted enzyme related to lactoylglutathione lyase